MLSAFQGTMWYLFGFFFHLSPTGIHTNSHLSNWWPRDADLGSFSNIFFLLADEEILFNRPVQVLLITTSFLRVRPQVKYTNHWDRNLRLQGWADSDAWWLVTNSAPVIGASHSSSRNAPILELTIYRKIVKPTNYGNAITSHDCWCMEIAEYCLLSKEIFDSWRSQETIGLARFEEIIIIIGRCLTAKKGCLQNKR